MLIKCTKKGKPTLEKKKSPYPKQNLLFTHIKHIKVILKDSVVTVLKTRHFIVIVCHQIQHTYIIPCDLTKCAQRHDVIVTWS